MKTDLTIVLDNQEYRLYLNDKLIEHNIGTISHREETQLIVREWTDGRPWNVYVADNGIGPTRFTVIIE